MAATVTYQDIEKKLKVFKEGFNPSEIPYIILGAFGTSNLPPSTGIPGWTKQPEAATSASSMPSAFV